MSRTTTAPLRLTRRRRVVRPFFLVLAVLTVFATLVGCSRAGDDDDDDAPVPLSGGTPAAELRLGYFPNVTHAPALVGVERSTFATALGNTKLTTQTFNAGPTEVSALLGGSLDFGFIGSSPALNAFKESNGNIVVIGGVTQGGAQLVVRPEITSQEQLAGKQIATPQLGNTQDVALKKWIKETGIDAKPNNIENAKVIDAYKAGSIDGGWLPEPHASRLVIEEGAHQLIDERDLWPNGEFPTTVLIARKDFLRDHPETVQAFLAGLHETIDWINANPAEAKTVANAALEKLAGKPLAQPVIDRAFESVTFSLDPLAATFPQLSKDSVTAGVADAELDLSGFVALGPLNAVLEKAGEPTIGSAGLDQR